MNRVPRRWVDQSARIRVIEGWHPSQPDGLGYNLMVDDEWIGTFDSLEDAALEAGGHLRPRGSRLGRGKVALLPHLTS